MMLDLDLIFANKIIATMEPEKPKSLLKKYFLLWLKMTKLIYKLWCIDDNLSMYPNLNKYKHKKYQSLRGNVHDWRLKKKELETELKELI